MEPANIFPQNHQQNLPNATAVLVLGILSLVGMCCYGLPGLTLSIIAVVLASKDLRMYRIDPAAYTISSYKNLMAGRTCAIIALILIGISIISCIILVATIGVAALTDPTWWNQFH